MKRFLHILVVLLVPTIILANGFNTNPAGDEIVKAFSAGDASSVAKYFDSSVDIIILDESDTYSKQQAEQVLKTFFTNNKVTSFKTVHSMNSSGGSSESFVGQMTAGGNSYRVYVVLANSGSSKIIQEISIRER